MALERSLTWNAGQVFTRSAILNAPKVKHFGQLRLHDLHVVDGG
jgi:hypothetical protein